MKKALLFILPLGLMFAACSEQQMDAAMDDNNNMKGSITAGDAAADNAEDMEVTRVSKPKWQKLANFNGSKNQKTKSFKVSGEEWKVEWDVKGGSDEEFIIILKNRHDKDDSEIIANQSGKGKDFADFEGGKGEYYLDISAKAPYSVTVSEFK
ncbi:MAG: hypothetical protein KF690_01670 [Bacteroidetes bacterium]|nr:hypothetical protein [Bacteroidota bacterium]